MENLRYNCARNDKSIDLLIQNTGDMLLHVDLIEVLNLMYDVEISPCRTICPWMYVWCYELLPEKYRIP